MARAWIAMSPTGSPGSSRATNGIHRWPSSVSPAKPATAKGEHIERNRNPIRRFKIHLTTKSDPTVTNPASLKGPESGLACGQCHSVWAFNDMADKIDFNRHDAAFRPGAGDLSQSFVVQPNAPDHPEQKDFIRRAEPDFF